MNKDPMSMFGDLSDRSAYPGKRPPAQRTAPAEEKPDWDGNPRWYMVSGERTEFFTIKHLASAVNRTVPTIRYWDSNGIIPKSTFRAPLERKTANVKQVGDRLYTRQQIEVIVSAAKATGVLQGKAPTKKFTELVVAGWLRLQDEARQRAAQLRD